MPGPRFEAGGGGSQVEVTAGRERFLKRRAVVDSAPGKTPGGVISGASGAGRGFCLGSLRPGPGGAHPVRGTEARRLSPGGSADHRGWFRAGSPVSCGWVPPALGLLAPGPRGPAAVRGQASGPQSTTYPEEACQAAGKCTISHAG